MTTKSSNRTVSALLRTLARIHKVMKFRYMRVAVAIAFLVVLVSVGSAAQEDKPMREVYQAQAMGQSTQLGKTFNVTLNIARSSQCA